MTPENRATARQIQRDRFLSPGLALIIWTLFPIVVILAIRALVMMKTSPDAQNFIRDASLFEQMPKVAIWSGNNHMQELPP